MKNRSKSENGWGYHATFLFGIFSLIGLIYNSALEVEACYFIAFMCSIPFVLKKAN
jgi:hypothetical protein